MKRCRVLARGRVISKFPSSCILDASLFLVGDDMRLGGWEQNITCRPPLSYRSDAGSAAALAPPGVAKTPVPTSRLSKSSVLATLPGRSSCKPGSTREGSHKAATEKLRGMCAPPDTAPADAAKPQHISELQVAGRAQAALTARALYICRRERAPHRRALRNHLRRCRRRSGGPRRGVGGCHCHVMRWCTLRGAGSSHARV